MTAIQLPLPIYDSAVLSLAALLQSMRLGDKLLCGAYCLEYTLWTLKRWDFRLYINGKLIGAHILHSAKERAEKCRILALWLVTVYGWQPRWVVHRRDGLTLTQADGPDRVRGLVAA